MPGWMIYGANGYTGELTAREAVRRGMRPVLAGRSRAQVEALAKELRCESRVFPLDQPRLDGIELVLLCAGPFSQTSAPMVEACLAAKAHYVDITGEIAVFETVFARDSEAREAGITLLPGAGFDVVPTDCLSAMLHRELPDASELWLAFSSRGGTSRGTRRTMLEGASHGGAIRRGGRIVRVPHLWDVRTIPFPSGERLATTIPWGDISTAWRSTAIPDIRVYSAQSPRAVRRLRRMLPFLPLLRLRPIAALAKAITSRSKGPAEADRKRGAIEVWGRVSNPAGEAVSMTMTVLEGYTFTVLSSIAAVSRIIESPRPGAWTPSQLFGPDFVTEIEGTAVYKAVREGDSG